MLAVDETVVVGKFNKWPRPDFFDRANFGDDFLDRFQFVTGGQQNRAGAKLATVWTAPAGLDGDAIVFGRIEQVKAGHGRVAQIKLAVRGLPVEWHKAVAGEIVQNLRPERFALADDYAGAMFTGFFRQ